MGENFRLQKVYGTRRSPKGNHYLYFNDLAHNWYCSPRCGTVPSYEAHEALLPYA